MKRTLLLAVCAFIMAAVSSCNSAPADVEGVKVIANRGYWKAEGAAQNTLASLVKAQEVGVYGSELDVNMTKDGVLVVCHGPRLGDFKKVQDMTFDETQTYTLENGEKVPTLDQCLRQAKKKKSMRIVIQLKEHASAAYETAAAERIAAAVRKARFQKNCIFISSSFHACQEFVRLMPENDVQFLGGKMTPREVLDGGVPSIDYHYSQFMLHPEWVKQAHELGMNVNTWTVDDPKSIEMVIGYGVDFVTTDIPEIALGITGNAIKD